MCKTKTLRSHNSQGECQYWREPSMKISSRTKKRVCGGSGVCYVCVLREYAFGLFVRVWVLAVSSERMGFARARAGGAHVQGFRSLSWLAYELRSTRVSNRVDPSARRNVVDRRRGESEGNPWVGGCMEGCHVVFTPMGLFR